MNMFDWYKDESEGSKRDIADVIIEGRQEGLLEEIKPTTIGDICGWMSELGIEKGRIQFNI